VLVNMPMSAVERPSLALGLLKSVLTQAGMKSKTAYANICFLEYAGLADYSALETSPPEEALTTGVQPLTSACSPARLG
ncbi:hypothetical protein, partial [Rhizobium johnstonii]|uniref:hypothetical protein n=1 Tax=Rhizobium johnstonii TaxID=3019933 RepID=UPI003F97DE39